MDGAQPAPRQLGHPGGHAFGLGPEQRRLVGAGPGQPVPAGSLGHAHHAVGHRPAVLGVETGVDERVDGLGDRLFHPPQRRAELLVLGAVAAIEEPEGVLVGEDEVEVGGEPPLDLVTRSRHLGGGRPEVSGKRNFTEPHLSGKSPWTGVDSNTEANVFSTVVELPTSELAPKPEVHIWGRCSVRQDGKLVHADRAGHPSVSSFFNTDDTKLEYNASEPVNDRKRWLDQFVHLMGHTGNYSREEAIAEIDKERTLPDVLNFDPSKPAKYPNGRVFTDDVIDYRLAFLTKGECPPSGLKPHTDVLKDFPYLGTPHQKKN